MRISKILLGSWIIKKIRKLIYFIQEKNRNAITPDYTRRELIIKCVMLFINFMALDFTGNKLYWLENEVLYHRLPASAIGGPEYLFYAGAHGLILGLTFWRILELYWYGKKKADIMTNVKDLARQK